MAAVLGVNLCKTEHLRISKRTTELLLHLVKVLYLLGRQCKTFLLVVLLEVLNVLNGLRLDVNGKDVLVKSVIETLQHWVCSLHVVDGRSVVGLEF